MQEERFPEGFVEALAWLCNDYDVEFGMYPESCYEGNALLQHYHQIQGKKK